MEEVLFNLTFWHWLALALMLMVIEIMVPTEFFMWLSFAAGATAIVKLLFPQIGMVPELSLFSAFGLSSIAVWRQKGVTGKEEETDRQQLNQRNQRYLGRVVEVTQAINNGEGKVTVEDSQWKVYGPDAVIGTKVKVVSVDGSIFKVELA